MVMTNIMPYAGSPSQVDSAGHPQGVALLYTGGSCPSTSGRIE